MWSYRLVMLVLAAWLFFRACDAQLRNEAQSGKLVYARGNHWAVGHLMGKKSLDETLDSDERDVDAPAYSIRTEAGTHTQPYRLLKALIKALDGPERETEDETERQERLMELRRRWEEQLARKRQTNQAARLLLVALNMKDADAN